MKAAKQVGWVLMAAGLFALGRCSVGEGAEEEREILGGGEEIEAQENAMWTCPMHPQIQLPEFGDCPICGMDLVGVNPDSDAHSNHLVMSNAAKELARIEVQPVRRKSVTRPVRMVGKVEYDETAVRSISAWVAGRLDRLYVDYTGVRVRAGDHLVSLYSPDLLSAQEELLSTRKSLSATAREASDFLADSSRRTYEATREKLLLWGLTENQVAEIEQRGTAEDHMILTSPNSGVVIDKLLDEGAYVETGTPIYRIADLEHLWVRLDAYEQDLAWLNVGQKVSIEAEALPGEMIEARIAFIDQVIDEVTRTAKLRVNVDNHEGRLKPGMFVRAVAQAEIGSGKGLGSELAGKWVSPMHPEIVKDGPGQCDVCGMDLVRAEELGLVSKASKWSQPPLVVPASAVLVTGRRAVVYVEVQDSEEPTYAGRVVQLGPRAGEEYIVLSGLKEAERVVVHGAFRIDSSMQILAKPSMMTLPAEGAEAESAETRWFRKAWQPLLEAYLALQVALADDDEVVARSQVETLSKRLASLGSFALLPAQKAHWLTRREHLEQSLQEGRSSADLESLRTAFFKLSEVFLAVERDFGHGGGETYVEAYCPMAFGNTGAAWLQVGEAIMNPYFGDMMLHCGEVRRSFVSSGSGARDASETETHSHSVDDQ